MNGELGFRVAATFITYKYHSGLISVIFFFLQTIYKQTDRLQVPSELHFG